MSSSIKKNNPHNAPTPHPVCGPLAPSQMICLPKTNPAQQGDCQPPAQPQNGFGTTNQRQEKARQMVKPTPAKPQQNKTTTKTAYYQSTGQYHNGSKGKYGMVAEATAGQADVKVGNKNTNVQGQAKVLTGEVKSTINTKKRSVTASLSATAVEVGGTLNHGNFGVGAKVGVGVGASGRFSMCDDQNKDGTHEVSIDVSGALLGKLGVSLRFTNPLGRFMCPSK